MEGILILTLFLDQSLIIRKQHETHNSVKGLTEPNSLIWWKCNNYDEYRTREQYDLYHTQLPWTPQADWPHMYSQLS